MTRSHSRIRLDDPIVLFVAGWLIATATTFHPFGIPWDTFIHAWRAESAASLFLLVSIAYLQINRFNLKLFNGISTSEFRSLILPMLALICWGLLSIAWADSGRSALHHALVWAAYLTFFMLVRQVVSSRRGVVLVVAGLAAVLSAYSLSALSQYLSYFLIGGNLNTGILFQKYGEQATALTPLLIVICLRQEGRRFALGVAAIASVWVLIICGLGRMNLILFAFGVATAVGLAIWSKNFRAHRPKMVILGSVIVIVPLLFWLIPTTSAGGSGIVIANRLSGDKATAGSNDFRKLMAKISLEMFRENPILGVGADNFGYELNRYRYIYAEKNPTDITLAQAESEIPERSHNEFLQVLAELGIVGAFIVLWFLKGIAELGFAAYKKKRYSPERLAALIGIFIFLASSLVTSFSFRLIQNGFVFFFLLAVCSSYFFADRQPKQARQPVNKLNSTVYLAMGASCVLLLLFSLVRVASVVTAERGAFDPDLEESRRKFEVSFFLDPENPNAYYALGMRCFGEGKYEEAAQAFRTSINIGRATSTDFSYLASAYSLAGDDDAAIKSLREGVALYPRSVFLRVRYAALLKSAGYVSDAEAQLDASRELDERAANTWWVLTNKGSRAATEASFGNARFAALMDLTPKSGVYAVLAERDIRFPGEREKVPF